MLVIDIPGREYYDPITETFEMDPPITLRLEHSLVSISKWESKWNIAFMGPVQKTDEQIFDYIRCMCLDEDFDERVLGRLTQNNVNAITEYIQAPMTATTINQKGGKTNREIVTSEVVYYWMVSFNIPFECQHWHLNRLLTLISVCNVKNQPAKKQSQKDILARNRELNAARRKAMNTSG